MTVQIGDQIQEYKVVDFVGAGNFGQVFEAKQELLDETRALKFLPVNSAEQANVALLEIEAIRGFRHPSIMEILDARVLDSRGERFVALAMPLATGGSLETAGSRGELKFSDLIRYMSQSLAGLGEVHRAGKIHRDIKPGNILIDSGAAKLSDFGLSIKINRPGINDIEGYVTHIAPENISGVPQSHLSDIYAAGVTLFRLVNGYFDFLPVLQASGIKGPDDFKHILSRVSFRPWVPGRLQRVIRKAMQADPGKRFQSADEFQRKLESLKVNIDWELSYGDTWAGYLDDREIDISIETKRKSRVVCRKNGKKWGEHCASFDTRAEAKDHVWLTVSETALA